MCATAAFGAYGNIQQQHLVHMVKNPRLPACVARLAAWKAPIPSWLLHRRTVTCLGCLHTCRGAGSGCGRLREVRLIRLRSTRAVRRPVPQRKPRRRHRWHARGRGRRLQCRRTLHSVHTELRTPMTELQTPMPCLRRKFAAGREQRPKYATSMLRAERAGSVMPLGCGALPCSSTLWHAVQQHTGVPRHV